MARRRAQRKIVDDLHQGQRRFLYANDSAGVLATLVCLISARRFGKTEGVLRYAGEQCTRVSRTTVRCLYQNRTDAKDIAWPILEDLAEAYGWDCEFHQVELACKFTNGSVIKLYGADDEKKFRKFKGQKNDIVFIDEAQDFRADLQKLVQWLLPGLADRGGRLFMCGTPGWQPVGYFFEVQRGDHPEWAVIRGTPFENPHTREALQKQLDIYRRANPDIDQEPWIQREYFGIWVVDTRKNVVRISPELNYLHQWKPHPQDRFVLGIDWGDSGTAFVIGTYNPTAHPWLIFLEAHLAEEELPHQWLTRVRDYQRRYPGLNIVADPGGISKTHVREFREVHGVPIINADKRDRQAQIEMVNSDASLGLIKIFHRQGATKDSSGTEHSMHPEDSPIARQWSELVWVNNSRTGAREEGKPRHIHDAGLFVRAYAYKHLYKEPETRPAPGSPEARRIEEEKLLDQVLKADAERDAARTRRRRRSRW